MYTLVIFGAASQTIIKEIHLTKADLNTNLLIFLQNLQLPIASSCLGEGVCQKCVFSLDKKELLACEMSLIGLYNQSTTTENAKHQEVQITFNYL